MAGRKKKLIAAALIFLRLTSRRRRRKRWINRQIWSRSWIQRRNTHGMFTNLVRELSAEDEDMYRLYMRVTPDSFQTILNIIEPQIRKESTNMRPTIFADQHLAITLRYLATGDTFTSLGFAYRVGRSTISEIVRETCTALYKCMKTDHLQMPTTEEQWRLVAQVFQEKWNYPCCIGAIDGKHIKMKQPSCSGSLYFNYKHYFSNILLALVDAEYRFLYVSVGAPGRCGDAGVYGQSSLKQALDTRRLNVPPPSQLPGTQTLCHYHIIGDDAFPLSLGLMKPYSHRNLDNMSTVFNYRLSRARRVVENAFGILANRFKVFLSTIQLEPDFVETVVLASVCLHNFLISKQTDTYLAGLLEEENREVGLQRMQSTLVRNSGCEAKCQRDTLKKYFSSPEGSVPWQDNR